MAKRENLLPYSPLGRLIQDASGKRVAFEAKVAAERILNDITERIVHKAQLLADHSGRKTIKGKDILLAYNQLKRDL